ncbi:hypothetical protein JOC48_001752 [Aquibacillus albus]|uniref:Uncharacterized protein n=1 Tax=Aquibacillus albus TaxID=1168171 RepID=A0ABS2MZE7_9BACI|nr:hypothetical protein [Aquibacillus albus]
MGNDAASFFFHFTDFFEKAMKGLSFSSSLEISL